MHFNRRVWLLELAYLVLINSSRIRPTGAISAAEA